MQTKLGVFCDKVIETGWLLTLILSPLFFNVYSSRVFEPDKLSLVRSIALVMSAAWLIKVLDTATLVRRPSGVDDSDEEKSEPSLWQRIRSTPLVLPTILLIAAYVLSTVLSVAPRISLWGSYVRLQGTYTTFSYVVVFFLMLGTMRRQDQVDRLTTVIILTSLPVSLYGILQHYGLDSLPWSGDVVTRVASNMGNSIFVAAYLIMAVPITLAKLVESFSTLLKEADGSVSHALLAGCYTFVISVQAICIFFTQSRGPLLGLLGGLYVFMLVGFMSLRRSLRDQAPLNTRDALRALGFALGSIPVGVVPAYVLLVALRRGWRWLWLAWVFHTLLIAAFLILFNLPGTPLSPLRDLPYIGRLGRVFELESGTGKVRALIWEGALELIADNPLRTLVGYGPETMHVAYNPYYPPELAYYEARNASPDRSHNETFDALVITGVIGFAAYMFLFTSIFYFGLKWLGFMETKRQRDLFLLFSIAGAIVGVFLPRLLEGTFKLSGVGLAVGFIVGTSLYLMFSAAFFYRRAQLALGLKRQLLLIGLLSAIVAHFIEIHFGIAIAATRTHFWAYAALFVLLGLNRIQEAPEPEAAVEQGAKEERHRSRGRRSRRRAKRQAREVSTTAVQPARSGASSLDRVLIGSLIVGVLLFTLSFEFVANPMKEFDTLRIIQLSLTSLAARSDPRTSYGTLWLFMLMWLVGALIVVAESERTASSRRGAKWWLSAIGMYIGITLTIWIAGMVIQASRVQPFTDVAGTITTYYAFLSVLGLLVAVALLRATALPERWCRPANLWVYPIPIVLAVVVAFATNVSPVKADIYYKTGLKLEEEANAYLGTAQTLESQGNTEEAAPLYEAALSRLDRSAEYYNRALSLTPDQDYYYLFLGRAMMGKATATDDPQAKELWFEESFQALDRARKLNPLNTDHYANLGRLYRNWANLASTPEERAEKLNQAQAYYEQATTLSPHNSQLFNEWALVYADAGDYEGAFEKLEQSLSLDPKYGTTYLIRARLNYQLGNEEETTQELEQAVFHDPENIEAHSWLGFLYAQQGRTEEAAEENLKILELAPDDQISQRNLAILYQQLGREDEANLHWQVYQNLEALALNPEDAASHHNLAVLYQQLGLIDAALQHAQRAVEFSPVSEWPALRSLIEQLQKAQQEAQLPA
jgi:tetratricopeptide (TPR) repeat protein/O-antigen ligase